MDSVVQRTSVGLFALWRMTKLCDLDSLKTIYFAYIHSVIAYGINIYGATSNKNLKRILIIQKRAIRSMLNLRGRDSVRQHFCDLRILTVFGIYILECATYVKINDPSINLLGFIHEY